jgi:hypothetical protein
MDQFKEAKEDIIKAYNLAPNNLNICKEVVALRNQIEAYHVQSRQMYAKMFAKKKDAGGAADSKVDAGAVAEVEKVGES